MAMGRPPGTPDFAPRVRKAFCNALGLLEDRGKSIDELIADELERDLPRMLSAMAKYMPTQTARLTTHGDGRVEVHFALPDEPDMADAPKAIEADRVD
jgi:hypothetical protein